MNCSYRSHKSETQEIQSAAVSCKAMPSGMVRKAVLFFSIFLITLLSICSNADVTISASGLATNIWYTPITTTIVNNSNTSVMSITASINSSCLNQGTGNVLSWNDSCANSTAGGVTTFTCTFGSPVTPGSTRTISGGINLNGTKALTARDIAYSYNGGSTPQNGTVVYTLSVSSGTAPSVTVPVTIGATQYNLQFGVNSAITLSAGTYNVGVQSFSVDTTTYVPTSYNSSITVPNGASSSQSIVFTPSTTPQPSGTVEITVSGLSASTGWSAITTSITNKSSSSVTSVQLLIPSKYFSTPSSPGCICWWPASTSAVKGSYVIFNVDLSSSPVTSGKSLTISGGLSGLSSVLASSVILTSYNHLSDKLGYVDFKLGACPATAVPTATVGSTKYNLSYNADTVITLQAGKYTVSMPDMYYGADAYRPSGYSKTITIQDGKTITQTVAFSKVSVPKTSATVTVTNIPDNSKASVTVTNTEGYSDTTQTVIKGKNAISVPSKGIFTVAFGSVSGYAAHPSNVTANNGALSASAVDYQKIAGIRAGYWTVWSRTKIMDAVNHGYDTIIVAFAEVSGNTIDIPFTQYGNYSISDFQAEVAYAKAHGLRYVILSVGGENNTFKTNSSTNLKTLAYNIVSFCQTIGADGIDFDLEIPSSALTVDLHELIAAMRAVKSDFIVTAAPQINDCGNGNIQLVSTGTDQLYKTAIDNGDFDYLFVQLYNTGGYTINGYSEMDAEFVQASFNYIKNKIIKSPTKIAPGEPANTNAGGAATIYHNAKYQSEQAAWDAVRTSVNSIYSDSSFGGVMTWCIYQDAATNYGFSNTVFWK